MSGNDDPPLTAWTSQSSGMGTKEEKINKDNPGSSDEEQSLKTTRKLDKVDELEKKNYDPTMTTRQRAMLGRECGKKFTEELVALPTEYRERVTTPEMSQRRKQRANEKRENNKKRIMEKLLKKHGSKCKTNAKDQIPRKTASNIIYVSKNDTVSLQFPEGVEFPLKRSLSLPPPSQKMCGIDGCENPKKYSCSQTGLPLCSLQCYKANQLNICNTVCP